MTTSLDPRLVFLSNVRISFPHIAVAQQMKRDNGETYESYGGSFLLEANDPQFEKFIERCMAVLKEGWKEHINAAVQVIWADRKSRCFSAGEEHVSGKTMQILDGYAGKRVITAYSKTMPQAIDPNGTPVPPENTMAAQALHRKIYGGCRVNVALKPWAQMPNPRNKNNKGIRCDLIAIQFAKDDTPFGEAAVDVSNVFGSVDAPQSAPSGALPGFLGGAPAAPAPTFGAPGLPSMPPFPGGQ